VYGLEDAKLKDKNRSWKNYYLMVLYYKNKYTPEIALKKVAEKGYMYLFNLFSKSLRNYDIKSAIIYSGNKELIYKLENIEDHLIDVGLLIASRKGDRELINFYLSRGARPIFASIGALQGNHVDLFEEFNKMEEISPDDGLLYSAYAGNLELMDKFLSEGARDRNRAMEKAALGGQRDAVEFLIQKGAYDWQGGLEGATEGGHVDLINFFISKGAKIREFIEIIARNSGDKDIIAYIEKLKNEGY
jgi:hypothetical protein